MRLRVSQPRTAIYLGVAMALALASWRCAGNTPTSPTPTGQLSVHSQIGVQEGATVAAGAALAQRSVSWSCFTAGAWDTFGALSDCPAPGVRTQAIQGGAVVTAAPTNLQHLVQGTTVTFTWGAPPANQPTSYVIEAGSTPASSNIARFDTGSTRTSLTVNNVPAGTYFVRVRGRDASGTGPASNEITVIVGGGPGPGPGPGPCTGPAGAPTSLAAVVIGAVIALRWEPPMGCEPDSYLIVVGSAPGSSDLAQVNTGFDSTSYAVSGVAPGTYYVRVHGLIGATAGPASNEVIVTVTGIAPPGTTTWTGLVANGDGITIFNDPECDGIQRWDMTATLVQSGSSISGIGTVTLRVAPNCPDAVGFSDTQPITGTATGSLVSGSGTITATIGSGEDTGSINGTFTNGRMTGTVTFIDGVSGTFAMNRQ